MRCIKRNVRAEIKDMKEGGDEYDQCRRKCKRNERNKRVSGMGMKMSGVYV